MKEFLKSPFSQLSIFFAVIGLFIIFIYISYIVNGNAPKCPNIEDGRDCWSYLQFWLPLTFLVLAVGFHFWGKKIIKKIEN